MKKNLYMLFIALSSVFVSPALAGSIITVNPGDDVAAALSTCADGDIIEFSAVGTYAWNAMIEPKKSFTIRAKAGLASRPIIEAGPLINFGFVFTRNQGAPNPTNATHTFDGISFDGKMRATTFFIVKDNVGFNTDIVINNCSFTGIANPTTPSNILAITYSNTAQSPNPDNLTITNSVFKYDGMGVFVGSGMGRPKNVTVTNCLFQGHFVKTFFNASSFPVDLWLFDHCTFDGNNGMDMSLWGNADIKNCIFSNSTATGSGSTANAFGTGGNLMSKCGVYYNGTANTMFATNMMDATTLRTDPLLDVNGIATATPYINAGTDGKNIGYYGIQIGPTAPTGLISNSLTSYSFTLAWTASNDIVTGYNVYKDGVFYNTTSSTSMAISGLQPNNSYTFIIKSKNLDGESTISSTPLIVTTPKVESTPPSKPIGLTNTTPTISAFTLLWTASNDNVAVTGYDVYKDGNLYGSTANTSLSITNLDPETSYSMTVIAKDAAENFSTVSDALIVTTAYPSTYNIMIQVGSNGIIKENNVTLVDASLLTVNRNTSKLFTFVPSIGYEVASLTYGGVDVKSQIVANQFTTPSVLANKTLSVTFQKIIYKLAIKSAETGVVNQLCPYGDTPSFSFTPSVGWKVNTVFYNNVDVTSSLVNGVYTVSAITANGLLNVAFVSTATGAPEYVSSNVKVFSTQSEIIIEGTSIGDAVQLYNLEGKLIENQTSLGERMVIPAQRDAVYLVKTAGKTFKVML